MSNLCTGPSPENVMSAIFIHLMNYFTFEKWKNLLLNLNQY